MTTPGRAAVLDAVPNALQPERVESWSIDDGASR